MCSLPFVHSFSLLGPAMQVVRPLFVFLPCVRFGGKDKNMAYNSAREEKRFKMMWRKLRKEYKAAGMSDEAIEEMYRFDWSVFNRDRAFYRRRHIPHQTNNYYSDADDPDCLEEPEVAITDESSPAHSRYWWIEEIENPLILGFLKTLSKRDIDIITLCVFEGYEQKDVAKYVGLSPSTLSYRLNKIKKILKNISDFRI